MLAEVGGGGDYIATYTHGVHGLVSQRRGSTTNWYHYDDLGSTRNLTNSSQTITDAYTYKAFGEIPASSGSTTNPFRYIGSLNYYRDADSTLLLLGVRYYAPQWGRFSTRDPARDDINSYAYVAGHATRFVDPLGLGDDPRRNDFRNPRESFSNCVYRCQNWFADHWLDWMVPQVVCGVAAAPVAGAVGTAVGCTSFAFTGPVAIGVVLLPFFAITMYCYKRCLILGPSLSYPYDPPITLPGDYPWLPGHPGTHPAKRSWTPPWMYPQTFPVYE